MAKQTTKQTTKQTKETKKENGNSLFTVYGARLSKSGERVNVSLVRGKDDAKQWATISVKLGKSNAKVKAKIEGEFAFLKIPMLQQNNEDENDEALDF